MIQKADPRNKDIRVYINGRLYPRSEAKISVFDSAVQGGDAVWEGLRVYPAGILCLDRHLERLFDSAKAMHFQNIPSGPDVRGAIYQTLHANQMYDNVHIRLTLTRGEKITSGMDPRLNQNGCTLIVLAEWKPPVYDNQQGIRVVTAAIQRNSPRHLDSKIHHNNLINNILAKVQANVAGVDAALMLDAYGFAAELNGTNIFIAKHGRVCTPHADACLPGITRGLVMEIAKENGIPCVEKNISLTEMYTADEVFATGTMGELTPVVGIDGRKIGTPDNFPVFQKLKSAFYRKIPVYCTPLPSDINK